MKQHRLTRRHRISTADKIFRRHPFQQQSSSQLRRNTRRQLNQPFRFCDTVLCIGTVTGNTVADRITDFQRLHITADFLHHAGALYP